MRFKKYVQNKKNAFTLVEILLTLVFTGVLVSIAIPVYTERNFDNRLYASTFKLFQTVNDELVFSSKMDDYCNEFANTVNYAQNVPVNCDNSYVSDPASTPDKPNMVLANGVRLYGMEGTFADPPDPAGGTTTIGDIKVTNLHQAYNPVANGTPSANCWNGISTGCTGTGCARPLCTNAGAVLACNALNGGINYGTKSWRLPTNAELDTFDAQRVALDLCDISDGYGSPWCGQYYGCISSHDDYCYSHVLWSSDISGTLSGFGALSAGTWSTTYTAPLAAGGVRCVRNTEVRKTVKVNIRRDATKHTAGTDVLNIMVAEDGTTTTSNAAEQAIVDKYHMSEN